MAWERPGVHGRPGGGEVGLLGVEAGAGGDPGEHEQPGHVGQCVAVPLMPAGGGGNKGGAPLDLFAGQRRGVVVAALNGAFASA